MDYFVLTSSIILTVIASKIFVSLIYKPYRYVTSKILDRSYKTETSKKIENIFFGLLSAIIIAAVIAGQTI